MKAKIKITDADGRTFEGDVQLVLTIGKPEKPKSPSARKDHPTPEFDFTSSDRGFVKRHGRGMSGPKKFVLLLAYLARGEVGKEIALGEIQKRWNKMTASSLLGGKFNSFYSNAAKDNDWVETKKAGVYALRPQWKEAIR